MNLRLVTVSCLFSALLAADRLTKWYFIQRSVNDGSFFSTWIFGFTQHENYGILANLPVPRLLIIFVTMLVLVFAASAWIAAWRRNDQQYIFALLILIAGALGNLWDRIQWGFVFDWILLFQRSVINLADIFIAIGIGWILFLNKNAFFSKD